MKKLLSLLLLIAAFYFVVADGMMVHFNQPQDIQWIYNLCAIVCIIPFSLYYLLGMDEERAKS